MRVLYFTESDSVHDRRFLRALANTDHQVYALRQKRCEPQTPAGINELSWPQGRPDWSCWHGWQAAVAQFRAILEAVKPNVVHAGPLQGPGLIAALSGFHPVVSMSWGSDLLRHAWRSPWMRWATRTVLEHTDVFLGDCEAVAVQAERFGFPRDRMVIFPWGVDLALFSPNPEAGNALRAAWGWQDAFVVFCNRTWAPLYGVDVLADAFRLAAPKDSRLRLCLMGAGPLDHSLHQILTPLADRVEWVNHVRQEALPAFYSAADLFVSPSFSDGTSISLLEALACGCPVLVSDIPGNREWIVPGEAGILFPPGDAHALSKGLLTMAESPDLDQMSAAGRAIAVSGADWKQHFQQLLLAYRMAVANALSQS